MVVGMKEGGHLWGSAVRVGAVWCQVGCCSSSVTEGTVGALGTEEVRVEHCSGLIEGRKMCFTPRCHQVSPVRDKGMACAAPVSLVSFCSHRALALGWIGAHTDSARCIQSALRGGCWSAQAGDLKVCLPGFVENSKGMADGTAPQQRSRGCGRAPE